MGLKRETPEEIVKKKAEDAVAKEDIVEGTTEFATEEQINLVGKLQAETEALKMEIENLKGDYMRKNAEFQNFRKRQEKELEELRKYAAEKVMVKLLDNVDNLERAIAASSGMKDFDALIKGVEMTLSQMKNIMQSEGVEAVESLGEIYDPVVHHAVMTDSSAEHENDQVTEVFQKGYKMKDKIIRPAMVKVNKK